MRIDWDPRLVDEAVQLLSQHDENRFAELRRRIDPLYDLPDRDRRIDAAQLELFRKFGAAAPVEEAFAAIAGADRALVARSLRPDDEGADLLVGEGRTAILRVAATRFRDLAELGRFARRELRHVADMLDPAFGYTADLGVYGRTRAELDLVRDRYRALWSRAIEALEAPAAPSAPDFCFDRAFAALDREQRSRLFARFADPALRRHATLVAAARDPFGFLGEKRAAGPAPGSPCPLCGFPTFRWVTGATELPTAAIRRDFPRWEPQEGACLQCADIYRAVAV